MQRSTPTQDWESPGHRFRAPADLLPLLGTRNPIIVVPKNVVQHIRQGHPRDMSILDELQDFVDAFEYVDMRPTETSRVVIYSRHDGIWRRGVFARAFDEGSHAIFVNAYRRDEARVQRAISAGRLRRREE